MIKVLRFIRNLGVLAEVLELFLVVSVCPLVDDSSGVSVLAIDSQFLSASDRTHIVGAPLIRRLRVHFNQVGILFEELLAF